MMKSIYLVPLLLMIVSAELVQGKDCANCQGRGPAIQTSYLRPIEEGTRDTNKVMERSLSSSPNANREKSSTDPVAGPSVAPAISPEADH